MDLGSVRVKIEGDSTKLQADLKAAEAAAANAGGKIADAFNKSAGSMNNTTATIKQVASGITQTGEVAEKAGKKVQSFVGAIPGMGVAAERFIGLIPGLGEAMIAAFPVFGAVAFAAGLGRIATGIHDLAQEWDPVISAQKRATEAAKEFGDEILKIRKHLQEMGDVKFGESFGKFAMEGKQAVDKTSEILALRARVKAAEDDVNQARREGAAGGGVAAVAGTVLPGMNILADRFAKGAKIDAETKTRELLVLQNKLRAAIEEQQAFADKSGKTLVDSMVSAADKRKAASDKALKKDQEGWEARYRMFEEALKETQAARDKDLADEKRYQDAMAEQQQRWKKINIDAKDQRVTQSKIDVPLAARTGEAFAGPNELKKAGILTVDMRKAAIAEDQRLLNMAEQMNVPLGTQLQLREEILQKQIDLKAAQGQSVSAELQALDALQAQMDRMHQKAAGIAPMLHNLRGIGGSIPGQLGGALAGGLVGGNPGKGIGQEIRGALQGIGQQILGTVFQAAIQRMVVSLGINTLANTLLKFVFGTAAATQIANTAAVVANTVGQGVLTVSNGILVASNAALTGAVLALTAATVVDAIIPFADGGRPPLGVPSIVGERGPEMFIPDQAGKIVPNHQLAGGAGLMLPMMAAIASNSVGSMNFHAHGMTNPREFVREVARQLPAYLKSTNPKYSPASR